MFAYDDIIQQGHRPPSHLQQLGSPEIGSGGLPATRKAGEKNRESLAMPRWVAKLQFARYLGKGEPGGNIACFGEAVAHLLPRDVECARSLGYFILRNISVAFLQVNHPVKWDHGDAHFLLVCPQ